MKFKLYTLEISLEILIDMLDTYFLVVYSNNQYRMYVDKIENMVYVLNDHICLNKFHTALFLIKSVRF